MKHLDKMDKKILTILQKNARISITELSEKIGLSATPVTERIKRMEREGVIQGYFTRINPQAVGQNLMVFVEIKLSTKSGDIFDEFRKEILKHPQILECHLVSGEYDYLIKIRLADMSQYRSMLGNILLQLPAARESRSYIVMEEVKEQLILDF